MEHVARTPQQLAQVLRGSRKSRNISQKEVGLGVGLLAKTVSRLETAPERASVESFLKLLSALELELVLRPKNSGAKPKTSGW
ncbi:MAG: helix-turn-helix domain-containing protein [Desulfobacterales bacterium]|nr:helix-turn-helix domain-containing protein [Desulfobacterales bacterium]